MGCKGRFWPSSLSWKDLVASTVILTWLETCLSLLSKLLAERSPDPRHFGSGQATPGCPGLWLEAGHFALCSTGLLTSMRVSKACPAGLLGGVRPKLPCKLYKPEQRVSGYDMGCYWIKKKDRNTGQLKG